LIENVDFACFRRAKNIKIWPFLVKIVISKFLVTYEAEILMTSIIRVNEKKSYTQNFKILKFEIAFSGYFLNFEAVVRVVDLKISKFVEQKVVGNDIEHLFLYKPNRFLRLKFSHTKMIHPNPHTLNSDFQP
jgi:hypothetical protein